MAEYPSDPLLSTHNVSTKCYWCTPTCRITKHVLARYFLRTDRAGNWLFSPDRSFQQSRSKKLCRQRMYTCCYPTDLIKYAGQRSLVGGTLTIIRYTKRGAPSVPSLFPPFSIPFFPQRCRGETTRTRQPSSTCGYGCRGVCPRPAPQRAPNKTSGTPNMHAPILLNTQKEFHITHHTTTKAVLKHYIKEHSSSPPCCCLPSTTTQPQLVLLLPLLLPLLLWLPVRRVSCVSFSLMPPGFPT